MEDRFERAAMRELQAPMAAWRIHAAVFVVIQVMLVATWWLTSSDFPWFVFPLLGWGSGLAAHYLSARAVMRRASLD